MALIQSERILLADVPLGHSPLRAAASGPAGRGHAIELDGLYPDLRRGRTLLVTGMLLDATDEPIGEGSEAVVVARHRHRPGAHGDPLRHPDDGPLRPAVGRHLRQRRGRHRTASRSVKRPSATATRPDTFQEFHLKKQPVTYVPEPGAPGGVASTLQVRVDGVRWTEVPELYGRPADSRVYLARRDAAQVTTVKAGDGQHGARMPSGRNNVTADYRVGLGPDGNVGAGSLRTLLKKPLGLKRVINPAAAAGGANPEDPVAVKTECPGHGAHVRPDRLDPRLRGRGPRVRRHRQGPGIASSGTARPASSASSSPATRALTSMSPHPACGPTSTRAATRTSRSGSTNSCRGRSSYGSRSSSTTPTCRTSCGTTPTPRSGRSSRSTPWSSGDAVEPQRRPPGRPTRHGRRLGRRRRVPLRDPGPPGRSRRDWSSRPGELVWVDDPDDLEVSVPGAPAGSRGMTFPIDLYELMPAVHRREDAGLAYPLEALLDIISTEAGHLQRDIAGLWDDFFIETAAEWVIPYIADLVGSTPLHPVTGSWRVGRREHDLVPAPEGHAGDARGTGRRVVTGWGARVVPFFEELEWAQHLDHLRRTRRLALAGSTGSAPSTSATSTRWTGSAGRSTTSSGRSTSGRSAAGRGRHNIKKIGFFLWRLRSNPLIGVEPVPVGGPPPRLSPEPARQQRPDLHQRPAASAASDPAELDLPGSDPTARAARSTSRPPTPRGRAAAAESRPTAARRLSRRHAAARGWRWARATTARDPERSVVVAVGDVDRRARADQVIPASRVTVCNLSTWRLPPAGKDVAIDPILGRMTLAPSAEPGAARRVRDRVLLRFQSAGPDADLGGGPVRSRAADRRPAASRDRSTRRSGARRESRPGTDRGSSSVRGAIADWLLVSPPPRVGGHRDRRQRHVSRGQPRHRAAARRDARDPLRRPGTAGPRLTGLTVHGTGGGTLSVDGMAVDGQRARRSATAWPASRSATPRSCPAAPSIRRRRGAPVGRLDRRHDRRIRLPRHARQRDRRARPRSRPRAGSLVASDSIIDSPADETRDRRGRPPTTARPATSGGSRSSVTSASARSCYASDVLFLDRVDVQRTQVGCIRFSYVRDDGHDAAALPLPARPGPSRRRAVRAAQRSGRGCGRASLRAGYGQPGYGQLAVDVAAELKTGGTESRGRDGRVQQGPRGPAHSQPLDPARRVPSRGPRARPHLRYVKGDES